MGKAVQGSALYHACPADIQRTSVSCTVNLLVIMSSIMYRQQQEQQQRWWQNNPQKAKGHRLPWWMDSQLELCIERWRCCPDHVSITGLTFSSFLKQTFHWSPWESHVERLQDRALKVRQPSNLVFGFCCCCIFCFCFFLFLLFLFATNTDRQTDKPKSRFQESTEAQDKLLWCYTDIFHPNVSHEIKNFKSVFRRNLGTCLCPP